jgi:SAM-dependent methyltransferase
MPRTQLRRRHRSNRTLQEIFEQNDGRLVHKWMHYFDIYERHFAPFRHRSPRVLEIGVSHGGSLDLWSTWFGRGTHIIGVDIDPRASTLARPGVEISIGDQGDPAFLDALVADHGPFDIVIDDGSHQPAHQILTLEKLWPATNPGGVFLVEDLHSNYWPEYNGDLHRPDTFIEFVKPLIDDLHAFHSRTEGFEPSTWTRTLGGIHVYDSIVVLDRVDREEPHHRMTGRPVFDTVYGTEVDDFLDDAHKSEIERMNQPHRRALRALRSPVESSRKLVRRARRL